MRVEHQEDLSPVAHSLSLPVDDLFTNKQSMNEEKYYPSSSMSDRIDVQHVRYPHCIVWTPIPILTWLFPFIGHMGIARTDGIIRDFAGPYYVSVSFNG